MAPPGMILISIKGGAFSMPQQKLTIVPVTLHTESKKDLPPTSPKESLTSICTIKMANVEISLHSGVDEYVIRTIMRELKHT